MQGNDIIVVGASSGGVVALPKLLATWPKDLSAVVFVVVHVSSNSKSMLPDILTKAGTWPAIHPRDGDKIQHGNIYVAPPDNHLWLQDGQVRLTRGPRINRHRPAIDPLFETAAHHYGSRVAGVILTGALDDGTFGLHAVKKCGGITIVQDPEEAAVRSMPESALQQVEVDHCLKLAEIRKLLLELAQKQRSKFKKSSHRCSEEMKFSMETPNLNPAQMKARCGDPSAYICPDCNGPLWEIKDGHTVRFRCLVGHSYSPQSLLDGEADALERALWVAAKTLEERSTLLRGLATRFGAKHAYAAKDFGQRADEIEDQADLIRRMLKKLKA